VTEPSSASIAIVDYRMGNLRSVEKGFAAAGVQGVVIIDGKMQHAVLLELFTNQGTGTLIHK